MADLGSRYSLLKAQFAELRERTDALSRENEELRRYGSSFVQQGDDAGDEDDSSRSGRTGAVRTAAAAPSSAAAPDPSSTSSRAAVRVEASEGVDDAWDARLHGRRQHQAALLLEDRVSALTACLAETVLLADAEAARDVEELSRSWQFRFSVFCMYSRTEEGGGGGGVPGVLCVLLHSAVFVLAGPVRRRTGLVSLTFSFDDVCGVAQRPWSVRHAVALQLLVRKRRGSSDAAPDAPGPSDETHVFWGFADPVADPHRVMDSVSASVLGGGSLGAPSGHLLSPAPKGARRGKGVAAAGDGEEDDPGRARALVVEAFESERYMTQLLGWSGAYLVASGDPPRWSDHTGTKFRSRESVNATLPPGWRWLSDWDVDTGVVAVVKSVAAGSPAWRAGVLPGDIVIRFYTAQLLDLSAGSRSPLPIQTLQQLRSALEVVGVAGGPMELQMYRPAPAASNNAASAAGAGAGAGAAATAASVLPSLTDCYVSLFVVPDRSWTAVPAAGGGCERALGCLFESPGASGLLSGWEYAPSFDGPFSKVHRPNYFVRRRRWVREVEPAPGEVLPRRGEPVHGTRDALSTGQRRLGRHDLGRSARQPAHPSSALLSHALYGVGAGAVGAVGAAGSSVVSLFTRQPSAHAAAVPAVSSEATPCQPNVPLGDKAAPGDNMDGEFVMLEFEIGDEAPDDPFGLWSAPRSDEGVGHAADGAGEDLVEQSGVAATERDDDFEADDDEVDPPAIAERAGGSVP